MPCMPVTVLSVYRASSVVAQSRASTVVAQFTTCRNSNQQAAQSSNLTHIDGKGISMGKCLQRKSSIMCHAPCSAQHMHGCILTTALCCQHQLRQPHTERTSPSILHVQNRHLNSKHSKDTALLTVSHSTAKTEMPIQL